VRGGVRLGPEKVQRETLGKPGRRKIEEFFLIEREGGHPLFDRLKANSQS
jgi:hypothetical protein